MAAEATILGNFYSAQGAEYLHGDRKSCLQGTREAILDEIELWSRDHDKSPVYWLNGLAGTGKTTIAQTVAERIFADGQLGASFFCSRDYEDRSNLKFIFPTLATQLARKYSNFGSIFIPLVQKEPGIAKESLYNQMDKLIVQPLKKSSISTVIIVDALDECKDEEPASAILSVLGRFVSQIPKVKFFLTGRPEPRIRTGFRLPLLAEVTDIFVLHDVQQNLINNDIQLFLNQSLLEIANGQVGLDGWPTEENVDQLCKQAAGLFVYAVATVRFIGRGSIGPRAQLEQLLQSPESTTHQGRTKLTPKTTLDSLYTSILQGGFEDDNPENDSKICSVLGAIVLAANPLSASSIGTLLGFHTSDVAHQLSLVHSLVLQGDSDHPVKPFHKSFPDFITDPARCIDKRFYLSPPHHHHELLKGCLELMNQTLEKNMCKLSDAIANSGVKDLKERTEKYINPALQYACRSWYTHLTNENRVYSATISTTIDYFLSEKFLFWLEVLSVLGVAKEAVNALGVAKKWLEVCHIHILNVPLAQTFCQPSPTLDLIDDCFQFVTSFFEVISASASHIYHSAIPLSPRASAVWGLYEPHASPLVRLVHGIPTSWDSSAATFTDGTRILAMAWSPCSRFIAVAADLFGGIQILDAVTLDLLLTTSTIPDVADYSYLEFSPDGQLLTLSFGTCYKGHIASWDLQTGGLISNLEINNVGRYYESMTYSECGTVVGSLFSGGNCSVVCTCNILTSTNIASHSFKGNTIGIWTHGKYLQFATLEDAGITIWQAEFTFVKPPTILQFLSIPQNINPSLPALFHPTLLHLAYYSYDRHLIVWDTQNSMLLLDSADSHWRTFSPDGQFFAYMTGPKLSIQKYSPAGYTLLQNIISNSFLSPQFSPNGQSFVMKCNENAFQLLCTEVPETPLSGIPTQTLYQETERFILEFSSTNNLAAVARNSGKVVTVLDLTSGLPQLTIDMDTEVYAARVVENTAFVFSDGKVFTWNIPIGVSVVGCRANISNVVLTTGLNPQVEGGNSGRQMFASISPDSHYVLVITGSIRDTLDIYDTTTGNRLYKLNVAFTSLAWFSPDSDEVHSTGDFGGLRRWRIPGSAKSCIPKFTAPWFCPYDYKVNNDGWIISPNGKQLLWLPHHWRSGRDQMTRKWGGHYLALLHHQLPEPVILNLLPEQSLND